MTTGLETIIFPVRDLEQSKALFGALLGVEPTVDAPYYVGFDAAGQHVGLNPHGHDQGMTTAVPYWHVGDVQESLDRLLAAGAQAQQPVTDVGGGKLTATVSDPDGNVLGLIRVP